MLNKTIIQLKSLTLVLLFLTNFAAGQTYIRMNQAGFTPSMQKTAVLSSGGALDSQSFRIFDEQGGLALEGTLSENRGAFLAFPYNYCAVFSSIEAPGRYRIEASGVSSEFRITGDEYYKLSDSLLSFLRVQRCGDTNPSYHRPCHLNDATKIIGGPNAGMKIDCAGGWHDAADYLKYLNTTSAAVYFLLLAAEADLNHGRNISESSMERLFAEIKIGVDWLLKLHYAENRLIIQVQDDRDHKVGWRMPENDPLWNDRPAYDLPSKTHIGSYTAALALAAVVYKRIGDYDYSDRCLRAAESVFCMKNKGLPEWTAASDSMYIDKIAWDNLALAGAELYRATGETEYLEYAQAKLKDKYPGAWVSWGDLGGIALVRLARYDEISAKKAVNLLNLFMEMTADNAYGYPLDNFPWGSAAVQAGMAALTLLYAEETGVQDYTLFVQRQLDFLLGANPHGVCFVSGFGKDYPANLHHQVAYLKGTAINGALAGGYVDREIFWNSGINLEKPDRYAHL